MASREALRAFQARLADRLQEARTSGTAAAWLAVEAAGQRYLFPLNHAGEIFPSGPIYPVPHAKDWFLGVANLRGGVSGVVDLAAFVTHSRPSSRSELAQSQSRLVAFSDALNLNCVVLIDKLLGLKSLESFVASTPAAAESPAFFGHSYTDLQGLTWQEINLQALTLNSQFLSITA
jgi:twitching motility protein PilI